MERNALFKEYALDQEGVRNAVMRQLSKDHRSLLEIGTGKGQLTAMLAGSYESVETVDLDADVQRTAMLHASYYGLSGKIQFISENSENLHYGDRSFDAVVSAFAFHHFENPFKVVREMIRVADKQVIVSDFSPEGFAVIERVSANEGRTHERKPGDFSIVGFFLKEHNFRVTVIEDYWQIIYSAWRK
ncbi:MAG: class I SAM-dependent methyltransferase [Spirochaetes bacterium]|nr:class I SAM-dependent methyltransferase [Spirochaetota bacterium]